MAALFAATPFQFVGEPHHLGRGRDGLHDPLEPGPAGALARFGITEPDQKEGLMVLLEARQDVALDVLGRPERQVENLSAPRL